MTAFTLAAGIISLVVGVITLSKSYPFSTPGESLLRGALGFLCLGLSGWNFWVVIQAVAK